MSSRKGMAFLGLLAACLLVLAQGSGAKEAEKPAAPTEYEKLVAQVKGLSQEELPKFDFGKLRKAFFETGAFLPISDELEESFNKAITEKDHRKVVDIGERILAQDYTDVRTHLFKAVAHRNLEQEKEHTFHIIVQWGLLQSILKTGDGKSLQTAWHVYQVKEEYHLLRFGLGVFEVTEQRLVESEGKQYDVLTARTREGETVEFYFDVTDHMKRLRDRLSGKRQ